MDEGESSYATSKTSTESPEITIKDLLPFVINEEILQDDLFIVHLKELDLSKISLRSLPEDIGDLTSLEILDISENHLTELPYSIGFLKNLTQLNVSWNKLANIPESIGQLMELTSLSLSENRLIELPQSIGNLKNLVELYASYNKIENIPESIGNLDKLSTLQLSLNCIRNLPREMIGCINLRHFALDNNLNLRFLPEFVLNLRHLETFSANNCNLVYLPSIISSSLKFVKLFRGNQFTHIPIVYEKFLKNHHNPEILVRKEFSRSDFIIHLGDKENNSILLLPFGTRKVYHVDDNKPFSLFELALEAACKLKNESVGADVDALPNILKDTIEIGPIVQCSYSECNKKLRSEYFLHIVKRLHKGKKLIFSCNFCSVSCAHKWIRCNEMEYEEVCWCIL